MKNRTVLITGTTSGIGKAAAHIFAKNDCTLIMACRNMEKGREVLEEVKKASGNEQVNLMQLDVSSQMSVKNFCKVFKEKYNKLDNLIHNAAYFNHGSPYKLSEDNLEMTFATNVFGPFLLTMLLRDLLKQSDDARILHAGSNIIKHFFNPKLKINFSNLRGENPDDPAYKVYDYYRNSKMALLMLSLKMSREFKADGIQVNCLQINGAQMSKSALQKVTPGYRMIAHIQNLFFPPTSFMAGIYYELSVSERFKGMSGKLFNHKMEVMIPGKEKPGLPDIIKQLAGSAIYPLYAENKVVQDELWELCNSLTGVHSHQG